MNFHKNTLDSPIGTYDSTTTPRSSSYQNLKFLPGSLSKPVIVGYMSVDGKRQYHSDLSQLKFLNTIPRGTISLDLNHNIDKALKRTTDDSDEKITLLLRFLLNQQDQLKFYGINKPSFICYRRTLISIMCNTYGNNGCIKIAATSYNGSIYLCSLETEEEVNKRNSRSIQEKLFCAWGYKFEQYLLSELPNEPAKIQNPVIENEEFTLYYTAMLGNKQLLYGAQIDGLLAEHRNVADPPDTTDVDINVQYLRKNSFIELKTNGHIQHHKQERNFKRYKLLRCWCQCYLANLKGLLVGYRTNAGIIHQLQWFDTPEIALYCKDVWNPKTVIDYLDYILSYIHSTFQDYNQLGLMTLQFEIFSNRRILISNLKQNIILPNWYTENIKH